MFLWLLFLLGGEWVEEKDWEMDWVDGCCCFALHFTFLYLALGRGVGFVSMTESASWSEYTVLKLLDRFVSVSMRVSPGIQV